MSKKHKRHAHSGERSRKTINATNKAHASSQDDFELLGEIDFNASCGEIGVPSVPDMERTE